MFLVWWYVSKIVKEGKIETHEIDEASGYIIWNYVMAVENFKPDAGFKFSTYAVIGLKYGYYRYRNLRDQFASRFVTHERIGQLAKEAVEKMKILVKEKELNIDDFIHEKQENYAL